MSEKPQDKSVSDVPPQQAVDDLQQQIAAEDNDGTQTASQKARKREEEGAVEEMNDSIANLQLSNMLAQDAKPELKEDHSGDNPANAQSGLVDPSQSNVSG